MKRRLKRKEKINKHNLMKSILILVMFICIIISMITYWIYAYNHNYNELYYKDKIISYKVSDYTETKGNLIYLKNIDEDINKNFVERQTYIINKNKVIDTNITKGLYKDILSIKISYTIEDKLSNYEEVITLNVDLRSQVVLSNDDMLNMVNGSYKKIATDIFYEYIKLPDDTDKKVIDTITDKELTVSEFNQNSEKYIIRIREKLPDVMSMYIDGNSVYYIVRLSEIDKVCYYTNTDNRLVNINKEIGKI